MPEPYEVSLEEMIAAVELDDLRFFEISARARAGFALPEPDGDGDPPADMHIQVRVRPQEFGIRVRTTLVTDDADVRVDAAALYSAPGILTYEPELIAQFVTQVGIKTVFPFLREAIADATRRIGVEPHLLGVLRPDEIDLDEQLTAQIAHSQAVALEKLEQAK